MGSTKAGIRGRKGCAKGQGSPPVPNVEEGSYRDLLVSLRSILSDDREHGKKEVTAELDGLLRAHGCQSVVYVVKARLHWKRFYDGLHLNQESKARRAVGVLGDIFRDNVERATNPSLLVLQYFCQVLADHVEKWPTGDHGQTALDQLRRVKATALRDDVQWADPGQELMSLGLPDGSVEGEEATGSDTEARVKDKIAVVTSVIDRSERAKFCPGRARGEGEDASLVESRAASGQGDDQPASSNANLKRALRAMPEEASQAYGETRRRGGRAEGEQQLRGRGSKEHLVHMRQRREKLELRKQEVRDYLKSQLQSRGGTEMGPERESAMLDMMEVSSKEVEQQLQELKPKALGEELKAIWKHWHRSRSWVSYMDPQRPQLVLADAAAMEAHAHCLMQEPVQREYPVGTSGRGEPPLRSGCDGGPPAVAELCELSDGGFLAGMEEELPLYAPLRLLRMLCGSSGSPFLRQVQAGLVAEERDNRLCVRRRLGAEERSGAARLAWPRLPTAVAYMERAARVLPYLLQRRGGQETGTLNALDMHQHALVDAFQLARASSGTVSDADAAAHRLCRERRVEGWEIHVFRGRKALQLVQAAERGEGADQQLLLLHSMQDARQVVQALAQGERFDELTPAPTDGDAGDAAAVKAEWVVQCRKILQLLAASQLLTRTFLLCLGLFVETASASVRQAMARAAGADSGGGEPGEHVAAGSDADEIVQALHLVPACELRLVLRACLFHLGFLWPLVPAVVKVRRRAWEEEAAAQAGVQASQASPKRLRLTATQYQQMCRAGSSAQQLPQSAAEGAPATGTGEAEAGWKAAAGTDAEVEANARTGSGERSQALPSSERGRLGPGPPCGEAADDALLEQLFWEEAVGSRRQLQQQNEAQIAARPMYVRSGAACLLQARQLRQRLDSSATHVEAACTAMADAHKEASELSERWHRWLEADVQLPAPLLPEKLLWRLRMPTYLAELQATHLQLDAQRREAPVYRRVVEQLEADIKGQGQKVQSLKEAFKAQSATAQSRQARLRGPAVTATDIEQAESLGRQLEEQRREALRQEGRCQAVLRELEDKVELLERSLEREQPVRAFELPRLSGCSQDTLEALRDFMRESASSLQGAMATLAWTMMKVELKGGMAVAVARLNLQDVVVPSMLTQWVRRCMLVCVRNRLVDVAEKHASKERDRRMRALLEEEEEEEEGKLGGQRPGRRVKKKRNSESNAAPQPASADGLAARPGAKSGQAPGAGGEGAGAHAHGMGAERGGAADSLQPRQAGKRRGGLRGPEHQQQLQPQPEHPPSAGGQGRGATHQGWAQLTSAVGPGVEEPRRRGAAARRAPPQGLGALDSRPLPGGVQEQAQGLPGGRAGRGAASPSALAAETPAAAAAPSRVAVPGAASTQRAVPGSNRLGGTAGWHLGWEAAGCQPVVPAPEAAEAAGSPRAAAAFPRQGTTGPLAAQPQTLGYTAAPAQLLQQIAGAPSAAPAAFPRSGLQGMAAGEPSPGPQLPASQAAGAGWVRPAAAAWPAPPRASAGTPGRGPGALMRPDWSAASTAPQHVLQSAAARGQAADMGASSLLLAQSFMGSRPPLHTPSWALDTWQQQQQQQQPQPVYTPVSASMQAPRAPAALAAAAAAAGASMTASQQWAPPPPAAPYSAQVTATASQPLAAAIAPPASGTAYLLSQREPFGPLRQAPTPPSLLLPSHPDLHPQQQQQHPHLLPQQPPQPQRSPHQGAIAAGGLPASEWQEPSLPLGDAGKLQAAPSVSPSGSPAAANHGGRHAQLGERLPPSASPPESAANAAQEEEKERTAAASAADGQEGRWDAALAHPGMAASRQPQHARKPSGSSPAHSDAGGASPTAAAPAGAWASDGPGLVGRLRAAQRQQQQAAAEPGQGSPRAAASSAHRRASAGAEGSRKPHSPLAKASQWPLPAQHATSSEERAKDAELPALQTSEEGCSVASATDAADEVSAPGLQNETGEYNCFLNAIIQCLWHCLPFQAAVLRWPRALTASSNLLSALSDLFQQFSASNAAPALFSSSGWSGRRVLAPSRLREALEELSASSIVDGDMNDAGDVLGVIWSCINACWKQPRPSDVEVVFGIHVNEHVACPDCRLHSHASHHVWHYFTVPAASLRLLLQASGNCGTAPLSTLLQQVLTQERKSCDVELGGCGAPHQLQRRLGTLLPQVFTLQLAWGSQREQQQDIAATLAALDEEVDLGAVFGHASDAPADRPSSQSQLMYRLRSMICYYGLHYVAFVLLLDSNRWCLFDDASVSPVGSWAEVLHKCAAGHIQPAVLFYEQPAAAAAAAAEIQQR